MLPDPALQKESIDTHDGGKPHYSPHTLVPTLEEEVEAEYLPTTACADGIADDESVKDKVQDRDGSAPVATKLENGHLSTDAPLAYKTYSQLSQARIGKDDNDVDEQKAQRANNLPRKHPNVKLGQPSRTAPTQKPKFDADSFEDPLCDEFWGDIWVASAVHNVGVYRFVSINPLTNWHMPLQTEIFRRVFRVVPDDLVTTWKHYKDFVAYHERVLKPVREPFLFRLSVVESFS